MLEKLTDKSWLIPVLAVLLPLCLLLLAWGLGVLGFNDQFAVIAFFIMSFAAPFVGVQTLLILKAQNHLRREDLKARHLRFALWFACLSIISPTWLLFLYLYLIGYKS